MGADGLASGMASPGQEPSTAVVQPVHPPTQQVAPMLTTYSLATPTTPDLASAA